MQFEASGGYAVLDVLTESPRSCPWRATSDVDWVTFGLYKDKTGGGRGDGSTTVWVAPNTTGAARTATITVVEGTMYVTQKGQ